MTLPPTVSRVLDSRIALPILLALATWIVGWWAIPIAGLAWGWYRGTPGRIARAAMISWALLYVLDIILGPALQLALQLGRVTHTHGLVVLILLLAFPGVLAWSSARLTHGIRNIKVPPVVEPLPQTTRRATPQNILGIGTSGPRDVVTH